jgi:hypothetical protein
MIKYKIDVTKIDKSLLYQGAKGTYLNGVFFENKNGPGEYGDDGFIVQDVSKEQREQGIKGPIIGNWRHIQTKTAPVPKPVTAASTAEDDDIPF